MKRIMLILVAVLVLGGFVIAGESGDELAREISSVIATNATTSVYTNTSGTQVYITAIISKFQTSGSHTCKVDIVTSDSVTHNIYTEVATGTDYMFLPESKVFLKDTESLQVSVTATSANTNYTKIQLAQ